MLPDVPYVVEGLIALAIVLVVAAVLTLKDTDLPGPTEYPLISAGLEVNTHLHRLLAYVVDKSREYKNKTWTFKIPLTPRFVVVLSPENTKHILKTKFPNYVKGQTFHDTLKDLLGDGIFNSDGHRWQVQRKTAANLFSPRMMNEVMLPSFLKHAETAAGILSAAAASRTEVDMQDLFFRLTLDSIGEIGFGSAIGSLEDPDTPFARSFDKAQWIAEKRFFNPLWRVTEPLSALGGQFRSAIQVMDDYSYRLIRERRESGSYAEGRDVLSHFMRLKTEDGRPAVLHDDRYLRDVVMNFIIAGRDTTAQALAWTVLMVGQNPEVERRIVEEVREHCADGLPANKEEAKKLRYTTAVFKEALRLWPSVPKDVKEAVADDVLPDGTKIKAGWWVVYFPFGMGRDTELWGPDAADFRPERFLEKEHDEYKYPVFNAGDRRCLGRDMAVLEATVVMAALYSRFHLEIVPGQDIKPANSLTMPQESGIRVVPVARKL